MWMSSNLRCSCSMGLWTSTSAMRLSSIWLDVHIAVRSRGKLPHSTRKSGGSSGTGTCRMFISPTYLGTTTRKSNEHFRKRADTATNNLQKLEPEPQPHPVERFLHGQAPSPRKQPSFRAHAPGAGRSTGLLHMVATLQPSPYTLPRLTID